VFSPGVTTQHEDESYLRSVTQSLSGLRKESSDSARPRCYQLTALRGVSHQPSQLSGRGSISGR
jgi:hypothetical protein